MLIQLSTTSHTHMPRRPDPELSYDLPSGPLLRAFIKRSGKLQRQVAEEIGADPTYVSQMVAGRVDWINSGYFSALLKALNISDDEVRQFAPDAVIGSSETVNHHYIPALFRKDKTFEELVEEFALQAAFRFNVDFNSIKMEKANDEGIDLKVRIGDSVHFYHFKKYPDDDFTDSLSFLDHDEPDPLPEGLQEAVKLFSARYPDLSTPRWQNYLAGFRWRDGEPEEPEAWLDLYRDLTRAGVEPGGN